MSNDIISYELNKVIAAQQGVKGISMMLLQQELDHAQLESLGYALEALADVIQRQANSAMEAWEKHLQDFDIEIE